MTGKVSKGMTEDRTRGYVPPKVPLGPESKGMSEDRTRGYVKGGVSAPKSAGKAKRGWGKAKK